ncbi:response regulator [Oxalobacteraceae bacterium R-40]|uniref:histidine kinase n=1 Tax=Keguizhuia sedimenti TaxID=3064264 RepID=A0ABU1BQ07_9BURK|nr:response regulator [Oxalobacteraceae bacterium R-40]
MRKEEIPKILVVNDDAASLMALVGLLSSWEKEISFEVITAQSGEEALRQVLFHDFAAILLDVNMPGMDGFETAEAIHLRPRSAATPIIFVTAYLADEMHRLKGYQTGAVDYLFTPIIPQILKAKLAVFAGLAKNNLQLKQQAEALDKRTKELGAINAQLEFEINERKIAEHQNRTKDEFLAMLGHELRNPLNAINSAAMLLSLENMSAETVGQAKDVIQRQSRHLGHIVDDLLDLSRVMSGKVVLNKQPLEISKFVQDCLETLKLAGRTNSYKINIKAMPVWVDADPTRLEQIVVNLLDNAVKFTPEGGDISINIQVLGNEIELSISDSGIGMPSNLLSQVFDIFVQGERPSDRSQGGLGIGLSLVRQLTSLHGGTVTAHSEGVGKGSTFVLRLPEATQTANDSTPAEPTAFQDAYTVLLVEDNLDAREIMALLLESYGHKVLQASNGLDGIQMAKDYKPDIVLLDIGLPGIDGHEAAKRLKANMATNSIPLIALTGYGQENDRKRAIESGFNLHLVKPVHTNELIKAIDICVSNPVKA